MCICSAASQDAHSLVISVIKPPVFPLGCSVYSPVLIGGLVLSKFASLDYSVNSLERPGLTVLMFSFQLFFLKINGFHLLASFSAAVQLPGLSPVQC